MAVYWLADLKLDPSTTECKCNKCVNSSCYTVPNCRSEEFDEVSYYDDEACGYGPWDTFVKTSDGSWVYDHTLFCLTSIFDYYNKNIEVPEYRVVLSGNPYDWDPTEDENTPDCWYEIDPYSDSE